MSLLLDADFQNQYIYIYIYIYIYKHTKFKTHSVSWEYKIGFMLNIYIFLGFIEGNIENKIRNSIIFIK